MPLVESNLRRGKAVQGYLVAIRCGVLRLRSAGASLPLRMTTFSQLATDDSVEVVWNLAAQGATFECRYWEGRLPYSAIHPR
jgi:hypothetical protein